MNDESTTTAGPADAETEHAETGHPEIGHAAPATARARHTRIAALSVAAAVLLTAGAGAGAWASIGGTSTSTASATGTGLGTGTGTGTGTGAGAGGTSGFPGTGSSGGFGTQGGASGGFGTRGGFGAQGGSGTSSGSTASNGTAATSAQEQGVVTIVSQLGYEDGESAGTGIVLTSTGRILTNNHVIDGATAIRVTDETTGKSYTAEVVGTDAKKDIAVLQLQDATGLTTATLADTAASTGDSVTAVGNAGGTGDLTAADGSVTATGQTITTEAEGATPSETLHGLIETDADVVAGDSGGPLRESDGDVVGITTAASSGTADVTGYAIPISTALTVAERILAGHDTAEITIGLPAFLGVSIDRTSDGTAGATVQSVLDGTPAAGTGLAAGDVITAVDGTAVTSGSALSAALESHAAGDSVTITWLDTTGTTQSATVTLIDGPAD